MTVLTIHSPDSRCTCETTLRLSEWTRASWRASNLSLGDFNVCLRALGVGFSSDAQEHAEYFNRLNQVVIGLVAALLGIIASN